MTDAYSITIVDGESRGGRFVVEAWRVFVCVGELRIDGKGSVLAAYKPLGDDARVSWLHVHGGPYPGIGQEDRSPMPTDVGERDNLLEVSFGTNEIENPCQKLEGKSVRRSVLVQKVCCLSCRGPQHIIQFLNLR